MNAITKKFRSRLILSLATIAVLACAANGATSEGVIHTVRVPATSPATAPAAARPYEVLLPPGYKQGLKPLPMVLYLHPSGEPQLPRARRDYWPMLRGRKCIMVLPRSKSAKMWPAGEENYLAGVLADVQKRYNVDRRRIILLGVGGGGQVALFLADHLPEKFRAVIVVSTNPVVVRVNRAEWFYPNRKTLKTCPYFVANHITQGSALMYWRQVRAKLAPAGASISILPVMGKAGMYQPPPKQLGPWLEAVLAGKHPRPLADPQKSAVAKMFAKAVAVLPKAIAEAGPAPGGEEVAKTGRTFRLAVRPLKDFERSKSRREATRDSAGLPMTQIRIEHKKWPIFVRCEAHATKRTMDEVLSAEENQTILRGMLYQVYHAGRLTVAARRWNYRIGSITYPDRRRGWVSTLFIHAAAPHKTNSKRWLSVTILDETQQPDAGQLAAVLRTVITNLTARHIPAGDADIPKGSGG